MELLLQMEVPRKPPPQKNAKVKEKNSLRRKAAAEDSSTKTYTATLTARSKAACGIAATILSIIMYGSPLSIIRLMVKTKSVEFMPFFLSLFVFLCGTSWFIFGLLGKDPFVAIPNGFGRGLGAVQLILYAIYCDKKSFPDGSGKMVGVDGKPSGEDIQLGIRMGQNQSKEELDIMLCGGSDSVIIPTGVGGFIACRALSQRNNDPTRASLPRDSVMTAMDLSWVKELEFCFWKNLSMRRNVLVLRMWMELLLQMEVLRKPPSQKRATMKPIKPEVVIVISHDTEEEAACGLNIKLPKEKIEDIDAGDVYNELILADAMGLGKAVMSIALILARLGKGIPDNQELAEDMAITQHSRNRRIKGGTLLIVCPMALLGQWKDELEAHSKPDSISVCVHYGGDISNVPRVIAEPDVVLTTYGLLTAAYKAVGQFQGSLPDFNERNLEFLTSETDLEVLRALEAFEVKIINHEHVTRRRVVKQKRLPKCQIEKLLDVFPQFMFASGVLDKYKNAVVEIADSLQFARNVLIALLALQSWKPFMQRWIRAHIMLLDTKVHSAVLDKTSNAAKENCMKVLFNLLPQFPSAGSRELYQANTIEEWSEAVRCLGKSEQGWLLDLLQISEVNVIEANGQLESVKSILVQTGSVPFSELGKLEAYMLICRCEGVAETLHYADGSFKRQWLVNAMEISCVSKFTSTHRNE
nr:protein RST1 isoform X1 [Ipomoea trifida]